MSAPDPKRMSDLDIIVRNAIDESARTDEPDRTGFEDSPNCLNERAPNDGPYYYKMRVGALQQGVGRHNLAFMDGGGGFRRRLDLYNGKFPISHMRFVNECMEYVESKRPAWNFYPWDKLFVRLPEILGKLAHSECPPGHAWHQLNADNHLMAVAYAAMGKEYLMFWDHYSLWPLATGHSYAFTCDPDYDWGDEEDIFWVALTHDIGKSHKATHKEYEDGTVSEYRFSFPDHEQRSGEMLRKWAPDHLSMPIGATGSWNLCAPEARYMISNQIVYWHGEVRDDTQEKKGRAIDATYLVGGEEGRRGVLEPWDYAFDPIVDERSQDGTYVWQNKYACRFRVFQRYLIQTILDGLGMHAEALEKVLKEVTRIRDTYQWAEPCYQAVREGKCPNRASMGKERKR